jgi:hypothetical protein
MMALQDDSERAREPEEQDVSAGDQLAAVGESLGVDVHDLTVLSEDRAHFASLSGPAWTFKLFNPETQESWRVVLDANGKPVDVAELMTAELRVRRDQMGALQPALHRLLEGRDGTPGSGSDGGDGRISVLIRYEIDEPPEPLDKLELDLRELDESDLYELDKVARRHDEEVAELTLEVHRELMRELGVEVEDPRQISGPFVVIPLPSDAIRVLATSDRVAFVGLAGEREIADYPTIAESLPTTRTEVVHSSGFRGRGIRIAVLESGTTDISASCFNIAATQDTGQASNNHMTKSVGIIGNRYAGGKCGGEWQGYAPDAAVYLANVDDYVDRYDWARERNVNVVTMSWHFGSEETDGALHSRDVFFDYWVKRWPYPSVFTSAGNEADDAFSSGKGFNFMGVGNVVNEDDGDRCDDVIATSSSWKNPTSPHNDHEVPAIAAPGSRHALLGSSFGGTSCATPVTASIAALLMSRNARLKIWPEGIRAILLATANYQDADDNDYSRTRDGRDGTGMINSLYAMWTAGRRESGGTPQFRAHDYGLARTNDFRRGYFVRSWRISVPTTQSRVRVALAWNSRTVGIFGIPLASWLDADLDLHVFNPAGNLVATGTSWDNSWEFVEFTPRQVGDYEVRIRGFDVPDDFSSWFGIAWTVHYDLC